ncbi:hypothetical protein BJY00DRAFT_7421 [Aspergillus carlsbadensis]|nr:hypothetical protein BJY00DRAFT_7421 [Aspergillus carlsbadensis]
MPKGEERPGEASWQTVSPYGTMLENVWTRFEEVNPWYSRIWRSIAVRLANSMHKNQCIDPTFGEALEARRHAGCRALAQDLLANDTFRSMFKTPNNSTRDKELGDFLILAADIAIKIFTHNPVLKFKTLHELQPRFEYEPKGMEAEARFERLDDEDDPEILHAYDRHRILYLESPFVSRIWNSPQDNEEEIILCKAVVKLEQNLSTDEKKPADPPKELAAETSTPETSTAKASTAKKPGARKLAVKKSAKRVKKTTTAKK